MLHLIFCIQLDLNIQALPLSYPHYSILYTFLLFF